MLYSCRFSYGRLSPFREKGNVVENTVNCVLKCGIYTLNGTHNNSNKEYGKKINKKKPNHHQQQHQQHQQLESNNILAQVIVLMKEKLFIKIIVEI